LDLLQHGVLDAFVDQNSVRTRGDKRSLYAADALRRVLESAELERVRETYPLTQGFPLRVELNYLDPPNAPNTNALTLAQLLPTATPRDAQSAPTADAASDSAVQTQLRQAEQSALSQINLQTTADKEIIVPSLLNPPAPFVQVILAFLYVLPVTFVSVFFTSSFMDEKTNRRLTILLSAPVTPLQIILGKMLPYVTFSLCATVLSAVVTGAPVLLALAIFVPVIFFIFAIYLMVPLLYRTFQDTTFISMLATCLLIGYLIFPALFSGINDLAYMSPLTLAVKTYRGEALGLREYLFAALPMMSVFGLALYIGTRTLNEEFLTGYRPLLHKIAEALYLVLEPRHLALSIFILSLALVPVVFLFQLVSFAVSLNLPLPIALVTTLFVAALVAQAAQSIGIRMLIAHRHLTRVREVLALAFLAALGFVVGQSLLLLLSIQLLTQASLARVVFGSAFSPAPLAANFLGTSVVCVLNLRFGVRYRIALLAGALLNLALHLATAGGWL
ncbi:MAG: ABC transporter permease, partial [Chloroflexi bacterium]|nr:ABC transporter permease [Chloroflexota bacterium]